jgi:hypothetical protein
MQSMVWIRKFILFFVVSAALIFISILLSPNLSHAHGDEKHAGPKPIKPIGEQPKVGVENQLTKNEMGEQESATNADDTKPKSDQVMSKVKDEKLSVAKQKSQKLVEGLKVRSTLIIIALLTFMGGLVAAYMPQRGSK